MPNKLTQPKIHHYHEWLGDIRYFDYDKSINYTKDTLLLVDELFSLLQQISPVSDNGCRTLWFRAPRGPLEDWCDPKEEIEYGEYESEEEIRREWLAWFPDEEEWYEFSAVGENGCKAIMLHHKYVFFIDTREENDGYEYDIKEFILWMIDEVKDCLTMIKAGTYNDFVEKNLPPQHRVGTVVRKYFYQVYPEARAEFYRDLGLDEIGEFCEKAEKQPENYKKFNRRLDKMTANNFYYFCSLGYEANKYRGLELSPKEQYYLHADGRDEGLKHIDGEDPDAFREWLDNPHRGGGHPWEVCRGGNSTHVSLNVQHDDKGYYLWLSGSSWGRTVETIKFYIALTKAGLPVYLSDAEMLVDRLRETEKIGIVPKGVFPRYCSSYFPDEDIIDYINLPYEKREDLLPFCVWQKEPEVHYIG
ncbi:MAG: hypothetical protein IJI14_11150 [Anaerolineaceae bacterium]|nr:hypothetical protein [Anaerolineaceae bacterium]